LVQWPDSTSSFVHNAPIGKASSRILMKVHLRRRVQFPNPNLHPLLEQPVYHCFLNIEPLGEPRVVETRHPTAWFWLGSAFGVVIKMQRGLLMYKQHQRGIILLLPASAKDLLLYIIPECLAQNSSAILSAARSYVVSYHSLLTIIYKNEQIPLTCNPIPNHPSCIHLGTAVSLFIYNFMTD